MISDIISNKKLYQLVTELFIRGRKLNDYTVFITQYCFSVPKVASLDSTHYVSMQIWKHWQLQQIQFNNLSGIDFKDFMNLYKKCTAKPYSFSVNLYQTR